MRAAAMLVLGVVLAGCAALPSAEERALDALDEPGAFPPRVMDAGHAPARATSREGCLEIALEPSLSAFRPGIELYATARVTNCGESTFYLQPTCSGHVEGQLARGMHEWPLAPPCAKDALSARELAPRESFTTSFSWHGFLAGDACGAREQGAGRVPASPGRYQIAVHAASVRGLAVEARTSVIMMDDGHELASRWDEGDRSFRTLRSAFTDPHVITEKPYALLTRQSEWQDFCKYNSAEDDAALGWPYFDFERESVLVAVEACVLRVVPNTSDGLVEVHARTCPGFLHVVSVPRPEGRIEMVYA